MDEPTDGPEDAACAAAWCAGDDWCAVTCAMDVIGNKWHPVIVHRLLDRGTLRFNALAAKLGGITNKTLSNSLDDLEEKGIVDRTVEGTKPVRVSYSLTGYGESLEPVIESLEEWGKAYLQPASGGTIADP